MSNLREYVQPVPLEPGRQPVPGCPRQDPHCPGLHGDSEGLTPLERALAVRLDRTHGQLTDELRSLRDSVPDRRSVYAALVALYLLAAFALAGLMEARGGSAGAAASATRQLLPQGVTP